METGQAECVRRLVAFASLWLPRSTMAAALHEARATINLDEPADFVGWCAFDAFGAA